MEWKDGLFPGTISSGNIMEGGQDEYKNFIKMGRTKAGASERTAEVWKP